MKRSRKSVLNINVERCGLSLKAVLAVYRNSLELNLVLQEMHDRPIISDWIAVPEKQQNYANQIKKITSSTDLTYRGSDIKRIVDKVAL